MKTTKATKPSAENAVENAVQMYKVTGIMPREFNTLQGCLKRGTKHQNINSRFTVVSAIAKQYETFTAEQFKAVFNALRKDEILTAETGTADTYLKHLTLPISKYFEKV